MRGRRRKEAPPPLRGANPSNGSPYRVIHVGDSGHARTAARFALESEADNISVDPVLNLDLVEAWRERFGIRRLVLRRAKVEDIADELNALPRAQVLVTFVHAHVNVDQVLARLRWDAAFTLACCLPGRQLTQLHVPAHAGIDPNVLSSGRQYQVLVNHGGAVRDHGPAVVEEEPSCGGQQGARSGRQRRSRAAPSPALVSKHHAGAAGGGAKEEGDRVGTSGTR